MARKRQKKHKVKVIRVVQVDGSRFSTLGPAVQAISWQLAMRIWDNYRQHYLDNGENYEALRRLEEKAARRVQPLIERMLPK